MSEILILIGELSRRTGCHIETIRYYERIGVIPKAQRRGRYRSYRPADVSRLRFIHRARELGFSLAEVRALLDLGSQRRSGSCSRVKAVASEHVRGVRAKIADLERLVDVLEHPIARCEDGRSPRCRILDALEAA
jgi:MerR family mercuric resistance operon transcriptional regulator